MDFVAVDVETANADRASICQIGLAKYEQGVLSQEWKSYVDPEDYFDDINVYIHGIDESVVKGAPTFPALADKLYSFLDTRVIVCHTHFDRVAMHQAAVTRKPAAHRINERSAHTPASWCVNMTTWRPLSGM